MRQSMILAKRSLTKCGLTAIVAVLTLALPASKAAALDDGALCRRETERQGSAQGLPPNLLTALSLVESGRWDDKRKERTAWPWTVTAEGRGRYFPTKREAVAEVQRLQARGIRNIDVGCMQVNLLHHSQAFSSLAAAFDPSSNVAYAIRFLKQLKTEVGSWNKAALRYHSATPEYARRYGARLEEAFAELARSGTKKPEKETLFATLMRSSPARPAAPADARRNGAAPRPARPGHAQDQAAQARNSARSAAADWRVQRVEEWRARQAPGAAGGAS